MRPFGTTSATCSTRSQASAATRTRSSPRAIFALSALVAISSVAHAGGHWPSDGDDEALPCRPTIACTASIVPPGDVELELGYLYRRLANHEPQHTSPFLLKLSVTKWLQLQLSSNGYTSTNLAPKSRYFDDIAVGAKLHLVGQHDFFPSLSWSFLLSVPMPPQRGYVRGYDALLTAYITEKFAKLEADLNIGMNLFQLSGALTVQPWVALALSYEVRRGFVLMAENYYYADATPVAVHDGGTLLAVSYTPRSWIVIDVGADAGWFPKDRSVSAFVGTTVIVGNLWAPKKRH